MKLEKRESLDRPYFERLDAADPLAGHREAFELPAGMLYFDGNSLGPLAKASKRRLRRVAEEEWALDLISSWNRHDWIDSPRRLGALLAPLIGARSHEVIVCDSVSVNLFKLLSAALELSKGARTILCQADHFPTDRYIAQGLVDRLGGDHRLVPFEVEDLEAALDQVGPDIAAVCLSHVDFRSGRLEEMGSITRRVQEAGGLVVWDLSHSAGALAVELGALNVDMAVGCGYKFLNGGPGAPSFLYVAERHHTSMRTPLQGWLGHAEPFAFSEIYEPAPGMGRFVCGTPPILAMAALEGALENFAAVDMALVREKSIDLGEAFLRLVEEQCPGVFEVFCPRDPRRRGSQVTLRHPRGYALIQALIGHRVVGDFRAPDLLRFGLTPLYQRYTDIWDAVAVLRRVLESGEYLEERFERRQKVT